MNLRDYSLSTLIAAAFALSLPVLAADVPAPAAGSNPAPTAANSAGTALHALFDREWDRNMRENPLEASDLGDYRYNDQWPHASLAAVQKSHDEDQQDLADLVKIDRNALSPQDQVSYDLFKWQLNDSNDA
ncbi:MAG TPA: DUF885 family protein, partial [Acidisoma sp.]|nr:DUF885 family protein [Acidisoma sp.]